jgi:hypothetical protein
VGVWPAADARARLRRLAWALGPGVVAQSLWALRTSLVGTTEPIRQFALYDGLSESLRQGFSTIAAWLVPEHRWTSPMPHRALVAALVAGLVILVLTLGVRALIDERRSSVSPADGNPARVEVAWRAIVASAMMVLSYLAILVASRLVADPDIPFDQRLLSP